MNPHVDWLRVLAYPQSQLTDQRRIILGLLGSSPFEQWLFGLVGGVIEST